MPRTTKTQRYHQNCTAPVTSRSANSNANNTYREAVALKKKNTFLCCTLRSANLSANNTAYREAATQSHLSITLYSGRRGRCLYDDFDIATLLSTLPTHPRPFAAAILKNIITTYALITILETTILLSPALITHMYVTMLRPRT
jgi:hypothetical protein